MNSMLSVIMLLSFVLWILTPFVYGKLIKHYAQQNISWWYGFKALFVASLVAALVAHLPFIILENFVSKDLIQVDLKDPIVAVLQLILFCVFMVRTEFRKYSVDARAKAKILGGLLLYYFIISFVPLILIVSLVSSTS